MPEAAAATVEVVVAASPYWWITPLVVFLSAIVAGCLSYQSIRTNRDIARRRATLDLIEKSESTPYYQEMVACFSELRKAGDKFRQIENPTNSEIKKQRAKIISYLNHYELIAIGCANGILDEVTYKTYMRSVVVRDWEAAEPFIDFMRRPESADITSADHAKSIYANFEALAKKWGASPQMALPLNTTQAKA